MAIKKKIGRLSFLVFVFVLAMNAEVRADGPFAGGDGLTPETAYLIATPAHLNNVRYNLESYFRLTANINLAGYLSPEGDGYNEGAGWVPIGSETDKFTGHFDGNGYTITGLYINQPNGDNVGLFDKISGQATVKNLGLPDVDVKGSNNVGGLAGDIESGQIENCYVTGAVTGNYFNIGGLAGINYGTITNCYSVSAVTSDESDCNGVGGLVGGNFGTVGTCYSAGNVTCIGSADVMAIGGFSGFNTGTISNCYATGAVTGGIGIGGLTGANCTLYGNNTGTINYCYATGTVAGIMNVGGLIGANTNLDNKTGTINHSFYGSETTGQPANGLGTPLTTTQMKSSNTFTDAGWDFTVTWRISGDINGGYPSLFWQHTYTITFDKNGGNTEPIPSTKTTVRGHIADGLPGAPTRNGYTFSGWNTAADGSGTAFTAETVVIQNITVYAQWTRLFAEGSGNGLTMDTAFLIATPEHLNNMRNYLVGSYYFRLTANIDLSGYLSAGGAGYNGGVGWEPIGTETASFNGHLDGNGHTISGLRINRPGSHNVGLFAYSQADIRSLSLSNVDVKGGDSTGALAGLSYGTGAIIACVSSGSVAGAGYVGGLVGNNGAAMTECTATGTITGVNYVGGLTGYNSGNIIKSHCATGTVSGDDYIGGLTGYNAGTITNAFTTSYAVSVDNANDEYVGGLVGYNATAGRITGCFSCGSVTGFNWLGGLAGANDGTINNSNSGASLSGSAYFGGLVGINFMHGVITNCYAGSIVTGRDGLGTILGGLVGSNYGSIVDCHATGMVFGHSGVGGLVGINEGDSLSQIYGSISNCYASGDVSGITIIGGLVGQNKGSITESYATGQVTGSESNDAFTGIGGLAGTNSWTIDECYATGAVRGRRYVGGLVGENLGPVTNSHASGVVTGYGYTGGLTGSNYGAITESYSTGTVKNAYVTGGLVGENRGTVLRCYAAGEVTTGGNDVGGLLGSNTGTVTDSYAAGKVTGGNHNVGGLVGSNYNEDSLGGYLVGTVNRCYSIGAVTGIFEVGGLVGVNQMGDNAGTVTDSFYDSTSSGWSDTGKGTPKTTEEMKQQATFTGWDFTGIWRIMEDYTYPRLQWEGPIYMVTFHARGGSATASTAAASGARITAPVVPTRTGYIFDGWYKENTCTNAWNFSTDTVTGNITLYAKWTAMPAVFTITAEGGTISPAGPAFSFDESITVTANPPGAGKIFAYWSIGGVKVSYNPIYHFFAAGDVRIVANYEDQGVTVEQAPAVRLEARGIDQDEAGGVYGLSYIGHIVVLEGYTLKECGLVLINQDVPEADIANFTINGTVNGTAVQKVVSEAQTSTGQYMIVVHGVPAGATRVGRAYMTYQKAGEPETTLYSGSLVKMVTPE